MPRQVTLAGFFDSGAALWFGRHVGLVRASTVQAGAV